MPIFLAPVPQHPHKTVSPFPLPRFLTQPEYNRLIGYFSIRANDLWGLRNLIIVLLLGTLGLRTTTLRMIDVADVDLRCGLLSVRKKGDRRRSLILPQPLCEIIQSYLKCLQPKGPHSPLLISKRGKRISQRALQDIFREAADRTGIKKKPPPETFSAYGRHPPEPGRRHRSHSARTGPCPAGRYPSIRASQSG